MMRLASTTALSSSMKWFVFSLPGITENVLEGQNDRSLLLLDRKLYENQWDRMGGRIELREKVG